MDLDLVLLCNIFFKQMLILVGFDDKLESYKKAKERN